MLDNSPLDSSFRKFLLVFSLCAVQCAAHADRARPAADADTAVKSGRNVTVAPFVSKAADRATSLKRYLRQIEFEVLGSSCYSCLRKIEAELRALPGVENAKTSTVKQPPVVTVIYDMDNISADVLIKNVQSRGFAVRNQRDSFFKIIGIKDTKGEFTSSDRLLPHP